MIRPPPSSTLFSLHDALPISPSQGRRRGGGGGHPQALPAPRRAAGQPGDRKSTRLNSSHVSISYAVFCLKKKKIITIHTLSNTCPPIFHLCEGRCCAP